MPGADVVVTGVGLVTPLGTTAAENAAAWRAGATAPRSPEPALAGTPLERELAPRLPPFDAAARLGGRRMLKYMSEAAVLGCVAAREAVTMAGLKGRVRPERIGLYAGTGLAAATIAEARPMLEASRGADGRFSCAAFGARGLAATNPLLSFRILANMPPCLVSILEGIKGPNGIFNPREAQAAEALVEAWQAVADGEVDAALTGAADYPAHPATWVYLRQAGLLTPGESPAPAAAYVVFERAERCGRKAVARVDSVGVRHTNAPPRDPLAERLGRTFAAAPAVLLALACLSCHAGVSPEGSPASCRRTVAPGGAAGPASPAPVLTVSSLVDLDGNEFAVAVRTSA
jgi:3-oxoacyl-[acyl-carrier-protein] synthase II